MARRKKDDENHDLELTTFLNLLVVLICFLLVTSVFSRIAIEELKLPTAAGAGGAIDTPPQVTIEVILRQTAVQVSLSKDGKTNVVASYGKSGNKYDTDKLSEYLLGLKSQYKDKNDATLLIEPDIAYQDVISVMDAVKMARVPKPGSSSMDKIPLFTDVSVGDAP